MLPGTIPSLGLSAAGGGGAGVTQIARSLRFRGNNNSAFLSRVPAAAGNQKKWTWAGWVKRAELGRAQGLFSAWSADSDAGLLVLYFSNDQIALSGTATFWRLSNAVFRDTSAHMFVLCAIDVVNNTCRIEVNGTPITSWAAYNNLPNQNYPINGTTAHYHGMWTSNSSGNVAFYNGYMSSVYFIDNQYLDSSSFGQIDPLTGVWMPKAYTGSYGQNGFYLDFSNNSTVGALGTDRSGNGNSWNVNNFSVAADATNDSLLDVPTNYGSDTGVGGVVRGNYCTLNPTDSSPPSQAIIYHSAMSFQGQNSAQWGMARATMWVNTGKWYWEVATGNLAAGVNGLMIGVMGPSFTAAGDVTGANIGNPPDGYGYYSNGGNKFNNGGSAAYGASYASGDVVGVALDLIAGTLTFYKNGVSQGAAYSGLNGYFAPAINSYNLAIAYFNFGQKPFTYPAPAGFKCLCTQNFPNPAIQLPSKYFNPALYIGNHAANPITGLGHQPDLVWLKSRATAYSNIWFDSVRGTANSLYSDTQAAENTNAVNTSLTSFDADGFTLGAAASTDASNAVGDSLIAWCWKKGALPGVDIVTVPSSSTAAINHSLGVKPAMIVIKSRSQAGTSWYTTHRVIGPNMQDYYMALNQSVAATTYGGIWGGEPTATQFFAGTGIMAPGSSFVAYLFTDVPGFSRFGSYVGNNIADGPFCFCGFKPRFVMLKSISAAAEDWYVLDTARNNFNVATKFLSPNAPAADGTTPFVDFLSNGFKLRIAGSAPNTNGVGYLFAAFAETPFKYSRAQGLETAPAAAAIDLEYLVVGGGGGGGGGDSGMTGGGGGAGGMLTGTITKGLATYTVTVGGGGYYGTTGSNDGGYGGGSAISGATVVLAQGGGNGTSSYNAPSNAGGGGGSGGGSGWGVPPGGPGAGTPGQGFGGGIGTGGLGGAGGGAGSAGNGAVGGNGRTSSINGTATTYAVGGFSSGRYGNGVQPSSPGNYGGGADGGWGEPYGGQGQQGVVILRYLGKQRAVGGTVTSSGGYTIHTFAGSGTFAFIG
jgi:hypothetical protein